MPHPDIKTSFIIRNIARESKTINIFQSPILNGQTLDLFKLSDISESMIATSLIKGELYFKILAREIEIVYSDINLLQFNDEQLAFLVAAGLDYGTKITQDQLDSGINTPATDTQLGVIKLNGDLSGTADSVTVIGIQNTDVSSTAPSDGEALIYNAFSSQWQPSSILPNLVARAENDPANITTGYAPLGFVRTGTKWLDPRSTTPIADLTAIQNAGYHTQLNGDAIYMLESQYSLKSGLEIFCNHSKAILRPLGSWTPTGADSDSNYVLQTTSTVGSVLGVLQRNARRRTRNLRINYHPSNGDWLLIKSITGQEAARLYTYSADVIGYELVQVKSSIFVSGSNYDVQLTKDLQQNHGISSQIYAISNVSQDVILSGLFFDFVGTTHAVGVLATSSDRLIIQDCDFSGFSRAQIHVNQGSTKAKIKVTTKLGTACAIRVQSSSADIVLDTVPGGERRHSASGSIPRGLITLRHNCSDVVIHDSAIVGGCTGISAWGGTGITISNTIIRDMDPVQRANLDTECTTQPGAPVCAGGLDLGNFGSPSNWSEISIGSTIRGLRIEDCGSVDLGGNGIFPSAFVCDCYGVTLESIAIINTGASSQFETGSPELASFLEGILFFDSFDCRVNNLSTVGINAPVWLEGNFNYLRIDNVEVQLSDALTDPVTTFLRIGNNGGNGNVSFGNVEISTNDSFLFNVGYFNPSVATMMGITIDSLNFKNTKQRWDNCFFAYQTDATLVSAGQRMELFATTVSSVASRGIRNPSTAVNGDKVISICGLSQAAAGGVTQNTWCLVSKGPYQAIKTSSTVNYGDNMKAGGGRDIVIDATNTDDSCGHVVQLVTGGLVQVINKR